LLPEDADPDLAAINAAWPTLPEAIRAGILAMVKAASANQALASRPAKLSTARLHSVGRTSSSSSNATS
jgi:hypothetical protein